MSLLPEEYRGVAGNLKRQRRIQELGPIRDAAEHMSALTADPHWEIYGRYLEKWKEGADKLVESYKNRLTNYFLESKEYSEIHKALAKQQGISEALHIALTLAQSIIEQGEKAAEELKLFANAENKE